MYLYLNASKPKQLDVFLIKQDKVLDKTVKKGSFKLSENLLLEIDHLLKKNKVTLNNLQGILTVTGPGPFTSLRIAVTITNTLAYSLDIPVMGVKSEKNITDIMVLEKIKKLSILKSIKLLKPYYKIKPNIIIKK